MFWRKWMQSGQGEISLLGEDTEFVGTIHFSGALRIDGKVQGEVKSDGENPAHLIIKHGASVQGDVHADSVQVGGLLYGSVYAPKRVEILGTGRLEGDVYTEDLVIQSGAQFTGACREPKRYKPKGRKAKPGVGTTKRHPRTNSSQQKRAVPSR